MRYTYNPVRVERCMKKKSRQMILILLSIGSSWFHFETIMERTYCSFLALLTLTQQCQHYLLQQRNSASQKNVKHPQVHWHIIVCIRSYNKIVHDRSAPLAGACGCTC